jgi:hypothetical protein
LKVFTWSRDNLGKTNIKFWLFSGSVLFLIVSSVRSVTAADWLTFAHGPQRAGWTQETFLSPENVSDLELKWASQVDNVPLALNSLTAPLAASGVVTSQGIKTVVYVAGSSDTFFALDAQDGRILCMGRGVHTCSVVSSDEWGGPSWLYHGVQCSRR